MPLVLPGISLSLGLTQSKTLDCRIRLAATCPNRTPQLNLPRFVAKEAELVLLLKSNLKDLNSRRERNRSPPQLVPIQFVGRKPPYLYSIFGEFHKVLLLIKAHYDHDITWSNVRIYKHHVMFSHVFMTVRTTESWPEVWIVSWSANAQLHGWARSCCTFPSFALFFLFQCSFQLLSCCSATSCSRQNVPATNDSDLLTYNAKYFWQFNNLAHSLDWCLAGSFLELLLGHYSVQIGYYREYNCTEIDLKHVFLNR